jgi:hypothetical protein
LRKYTNDGGLNLNCSASKLYRFLLVIIGSDPTLYIYIYIFDFKLRLKNILKQSLTYYIPTAAVRVRSQVGSCGICGRESGNAAGCLMSTSVCPGNSHSTDYSTLIYHPGPTSGHRTKWTQSHPIARNKKKHIALRWLI